MDRMRLDTSYFRRFFGIGILPECIINFWYSVFGTSHDYLNLYRYIVIDIIIDINLLEIFELWQGWYY